MMRIVRVVATALLCAVTGDAFLLPGSSLARARDPGMRVTRISVAESRQAYRPSMSLASPPPSAASPSASDRRSSFIQGISSHDDLLRSLGDYQNTLVVIKFYDQFCRACDEIRPLYEELAETRSDEAAFFEIEFTNNKDVCKQLGIKRLPTVHIYDGSKGRVADMPAGPSRFKKVKDRLMEIVDGRGGTAKGA